MRAFFPGRFQPFHKGHLHAVKECVKKYGYVIIGIGTGEKSDEPFSFAERKRMISGALQAEGISDRTWLAEIPDVGDDVAWARSIIKRFPDADVVVTGNDWTKECFKGLRRVDETPWFHPEKYKATLVRQGMKKSGEWRSLVPKEVIPYIEKKIKG
jgi:nicotinamide-nucleotide adenylyltransferase